MRVQPRMVSMPGWIVGLLRAAAAENCPEVYRSLLLFWLHNGAMEAPFGVFIPLPGKPGRPSAEATRQIYVTSLSLGKPSLYSGKLAQKVFGATFTKANTGERKKMI